MSDLSLTVILHNAEQAAMAIRNVAAPKCREQEPVWAADTQRRIKAMGLWPTNLSGENE